MTTTVFTHTCACGNEIVTHGWNNNINHILRCQECETKHSELISAISAAIAGKDIEAVYVSSDVYHLLNSDDFIVEVSRRRAERMSGQVFQVVAA